MDLKQQYNEVAQQQRSYLALISEKYEAFNAECENERLSSNMSDDDFRLIKELKQQEFEQGYFGLTREKYDEMQDTKRLADNLIEQLKAQNVSMSAKEIIEGFEVI